MTVELTVAAARDIKEILAHTLKTFGTRQLDAYERLMTKAVAMVAEEPDHRGSIDRSEIAPGVRLFHLALAAGRRGAAAHCLYYTVRPGPEGARVVIVLRVLHESMEPGRRVMRTLRDGGATDPPET